MSNLFDKTFFKFLLGFAAVLAVSFTILYFTNASKQQIDPLPLRAKNDVVVNH